MDTIKNTLLKSTIAVALFASGAAFATNTGNAISGQLLIINNLANVDSTSKSAGSTASSVKVVVSDSVGACNTTASLAYNGSVLVKWANSNTHSSTNCSGPIYSVAVTPLTTSIGGVTTVVYDSTAVTSIPDTAPTAITLTAPTCNQTASPPTCFENQAIIITGDGSAALTGSQTSWGAAIGAVPAFDAGNGSLTTTGIPSMLGISDFRAETLMRQYGFIPHRGGSKSGN